MCSRDVAHAVRARIDKDGLPNLSRRGFLRLGGLTAAGAAVASLSTSAVLARASQHSGEVIDLSHVFGTQIPTYLPDEKPQRSDFVTVENDGFFIQNWAFGEHAGTHVDIPAHFIADAVTVDNFPVAGLVGPAVVIDISAKAAMLDDATLDVEDIEAWEAANGPIPDGAFVLMHSGWADRWPDEATFRNADADGVQHYPGFSAEAATFLVEQRNIHGIGVDTLSLDIGASATFDVHYIILGAGLVGIECVANLSAIKDKAATVVVGVPRWEGGSGGPARVIALA